MAQYDPGILEILANALYRRANSIIAAWTALGIVLGLIAGTLTAAAVGSGSLIVIVVGALLGAAIGYSIGTGRAFMLKVRAQEVLCQRQIEENTRAVAMALRSGATITESRTAATPFAQTAN